MDSGEEEDVSARVLLRNVLHTETQRSPVTRRMSRDQSHIRRSSRLRNMPAETPHVALRHKLKQKLRETATRSPLPPSKRARSQSGLPKTPVVRLSPALYDDDDVTPRGLLRGIIQTEAEASLLLSGQTALPHRDQQDVETGNHANRRSDGASGLELPDLATEPLTQVIRGMSRRRPPPTFNVSAFEKQLDQPSGDDEEMDVPQENPDVSKEQDLSAGSKSVLSLTLKTPFVNLQTHRAGLRRKAAGRRRQVSVDAFDEAIQKRLERRHNQDYTVVQDGRTLQDSDLHKLTLGLSNTTVPELTTDTMMSNTELYALPQTSVSELRDAEGGVTDAEMKRGDDDDDDGREIQDVAQDQQTLSERNISKPHPDPSEDPEADSESQEEEGEVETIPQSQESDAVSLNPEDMQLAPMQDMVDHASQPQEQSESAIQDAQVEEMDQREGESLQEEEEPSHLPQRIARRAYRSEGRAITNGAMERGRGTKSLGMNPDPTEKHLQTLAGGTELEEFQVSVEEEPHRRPASSSAIHTTKPSSSVTHQDSLVQNPDEDDEVIQDLHQSGSEEIVVSVHVSPMVDFPAAEEEEEEEQEQQQQEEEEEKEQEHEQQEEEEQECQEEGEQEEEVQEQQEEEEQEEEMEEQVQEQPQEEEEEHDDAQSEELSMQTPGFIRQRKQVATPGALATPTILKALNAGPAPKVVKSRPKRQPQHVSTRVLPKSYVMSVFKHFAKTKVSSDVYPVINDILQRYFDRLAEDLEAYSAHAKRKTIEVEDVELLMRRQGFVTDSTPVTVLIEKFLPLEYRKLLIPVATSGNNVVPHRRR